MNEMKSFFKLPVILLQIFNVKCLVKKKKIVRLADSDELKSTYN